MIMKAEDIKHSKFSCFHNLFYKTQPNISEVIKRVNWGSNRVIKQQGFRVLPITQEIKRIKQWERITDPRYIIKESSYISTPKGQSIIVIHIVKEKMSELNIIISGTAGSGKTTVGELLNNLLTLHGFDCSFEDDEFSEAEKTIKFFQRRLDALNQRKTKIKIKTVQTMRRNKD